MKEIVALVEQALKKAGFEATDVVVTRPTKSFGDFATSVAMPIAKKIGSSPREVADTLARVLKENANFTSVEVAGPGFINMTMSEEWLELQLQKPHHVEPSLQDKRYIIEYSSPNIAKPMHVGHLRTTILGQVLVNTYRKAGAEVIAWCHPGDWGMQFGKLIVGWQKYGDQAALEKSPIDELLRVYVQFHKDEREHPEFDEEAKSTFRALQSGDAKIVALWKQFSELSQKEFDKMYGLLGVRFDVWRPESEYNNDLQPFVEKALEGGVAKESEGAVIIPLDEQNLPPYLIRKSDGATLYATSDLVSIAERSKEFQPDGLIYVVGNEQTLHFQQLFAAAEKLAEAGVYDAGFVLPKLTHVSYGFFRLATGKMSTRQGEVIRLEDVINQSIVQAEALVKEKNPDLEESEQKKLAKTIGIGAVKYTDLMHDRHTDVVFDWDKMFTLDGNSIVYLLYTNARCNALLQNAEKEEHVELKDEEWSVYEKDLLLTAMQLNDAVTRSITDYDPHHILTHVYEVATTFSRFYANDQILKASPEVKKRRLHLVRLVQQQLQLLFELLDIEAPERL